MDRGDSRGVERLLSPAKAPAPIGYDRAFCRRLADVFLKRAPGGQEAVEAALTDRLPNAGHEAGMLRLAGAASIRGSECRLMLEPDPTHVSGVVEWLLEVTASMLPDIRQLHLRSVLYELLFNAMEHGNLEIGYQAKRQALAQKRYEGLLRQRLTVPCLNARRITIRVRYEQDAGRLMYHIADEGNGFPWRRFLQRFDLTCGAADVNGRGILIARSLSTDMIYNERGNEVTIWMAASSA